MILIFAPYPYEPLRQDGMYRRILEIDQHFFKGQERVYVYYSPQPNDYRISESFKVEENAFVQLLDLQYVNHQLKLRELVQKASIVYAQTMIYSAPYLSGYYSTRKIITDAHGIAAEEEKLVERESRAKYMSVFEKKASRESRAVVVVTKAMGDYYSKAYQANSTNFIHLPINTVEIDKLDLSKKKRDRVIYSGGLHKWQNVDQMLHLSKEFSSKFEFVFLTNSVSELRNRAKMLGISDKILISSCPYEEVFDYLKSATYGLLLRDDTPVNNVAFPTKLIEYLASGVIPIIKSRNVGDLEEMGVICIDVKDFEDGNLPSEAETKKIMSHNFECYRSVFKKFELGAQQLKGLIEKIKEEGSHDVDDSVALPANYRMSFLPLNVEFELLTHEKSSTISVDSADTPIKIEKVFKDNVQADRIIVKIPGRKFTFGNVVLTVKSETEQELKILPSNLNQFEKDVFENYVFGFSSIFIFDFRRKLNFNKLDLKIDFLLYGLEVEAFRVTGVPKLYFSPDSLLKKFLYSLKNDSFQVTAQKVTKYIKQRI